MEAPSDRSKKTLRRLEEYLKGIKFFEDFSKENGQENLYELLKYCYFE